MSRTSSPKRRVLVVTGSRAEFGLLRPVMDAVRRNRRLRLLVAVAGEHLLRPALTWREVATAYRIDAKVPMQRRGDRGRLAHAAATGRGVEGFARAYKRLKPDWVVVLGDRVEAFAAASAASIAGIAVCHIHGGDRAEGIADEAMRHAITKLSHLHCAATNRSAARIVSMGERKQFVHTTGSPAIDGLQRIGPMGDREARTLGDPVAVVLLHPSGVGPDADTLGGCLATLIARLASRLAAGRPDRVLLLEPNHDPGREHILRTYRLSDTAHLPRRAHLPRPVFVALLKRLARTPGGVLIGNSSAGLIEAAAVGLPVVNFPPRQDGRERDRNVVDARGIALGAGAPRLRPAAALARARALSGRISPSRLFGDGRAGPRVAALLARVDPRDPALLRKRNAY
ncbi:MAG: UDP-N-acetylglucosamine 2-epimerase (hydrolyzing) [Phycisphaeraceae bacterium]|nr:UDP-N-acetylglucosamine 2-epimerase (hydrolyzing) [Phycisphaeraceae bacterium]